MTETVSADKFYDTKNPLILKYYIIDLDLEDAENNDVRMVCVQLS